MEMKDTAALFPDHAAKTERLKNEAAAVQAFSMLTETLSETPKLHKEADTAVAAGSGAALQAADVNDEIISNYWQALKLTIGDEKDEDGPEESARPKNEKSGNKQRKQKYPKQWR